MKIQEDFNAILSTGRKDVTGTLFTILYTVYPYRVEFAVHQAECEAEDGALNFLPDQDSWTQYDSEPNEGTRIIHGNVKWDGCTNWTTCNYIHCCERYQLVEFGNLLGQCYDLGKLCPHWDGTNFQA